MAAIKTEESPNGRLGWIADDDDDIWLTALERVALNLIRRYAVMAAGAPEKDVSREAVKEAIRAFQSFPLAELNPQRKNELVISPPPGGDLYKVGIARISKAASSRGQLTAFRVKGLLFGADLSEKKGQINQL